MLILKGKSGKSKIAEELLRDNQSLCFVYYNAQLPFDCVLIDPDKYSIEGLYSAVFHYLTDIQCLYFRYVIIYTNESEKDLQYLIGRLNQSEKIYNRIGQIIVMCKE